MAKLKPVTPGELLLEEFLTPLGITKYRLAKEIGVPAQRIGDIVAGKRSITADTDLRLSPVLRPLEAVLVAGPGRPRLRVADGGCWPHARDSYTVGRAAA